MGYAFRPGSRVRMAESVAYTRTSFEPILRKMKTRTLTTSAVFALLLLTTRAEAQFTAPEVMPAEDYHAELGVMLWQPTPDLRLTTGDARVGTVDFVREFVIGKERFNEFRATLKPGRKHKIRFNYLKFRYDQDAVLERTLTFQNISFPVSADANANFNWDLYRFGYEWDFISRSHGFVGLLTELKYNKVQADVTASGQVLGQTENISASVTQNAPVPTIGAVGRGYINQYASFTGEFTAFKLEQDEFRGTFYDFDIYGAAHFGKYLGAQAGYRSVTVDFLVDSDAGAMKMKGPYFGGFVRF